MDVDFLLSHEDAISIVSMNILSYNSMYSVRTREQTRKSMISCRAWQLIFCILDQLERHGYAIKDLIAGHSLNLFESDEDMMRYNSMVANASEIMDIALKNPFLNALISLNQSIHGFVEEYDPNTMPLNIGNNYMCIYIEGVNSSIVHFFTLIRYDDDTYYLNSSYVSDYVCVKQYTTQVSGDEFMRFVDALNNPDVDENYIGEFYKKFFLKGNIGMYYSKDDYENDPLLRFAKIQPDEGDLKEMEVVTKNVYRNRIRLGIMPKYGELVGNIIETQLGGGRKKRHFRKTNRITKKRKQSKLRKTKRTRSSRSSKRCSR